MLRQGRPISAGAKRARVAARLVLAAILPVFALPAAAETPAGTPIRNRAAIAFTAGTVPASVASNETVLLVAERLDVALARRGEAPVTAAPEAVIPLTLTDAGNGQEAFSLSATVGGAAPEGTRFYVDTDGDGQLGAADTLLTDARTAALAPGATLMLLAVVRGAHGGDTITLTAVAATGRGAPGATYPASGDGGGDAVVGTTGAAASVSVLVAGAPAAATLTKSQIVRDAHGGTVAEPGAQITYTLRADLAAPARDVVVSDLVPAGTALVPGSLTLDGAALTDAADGDAGEASAAGMRVALGSAAAGARHTITFRVTIR